MRQRGEQSVHSQDEWPNSGTPIMSKDNGPGTELKGRVQHWAKRIRVTPSQVRIQHMSRKWASCSTRGWCTFAKDLLDESLAFQDYVIVHELLHLRVRNHGRVFRSLLSAHVPGWRKFCPTGLGTSCAARAGPAA
jgi:predicted metal-dependent hydrolase